MVRRGWTTSSDAKRGESGDVFKSLFDVCARHTQVRALCGWFRARRRREMWEMRGICGGLELRDGDVYVGDAARWMVFLVR